MAEENEQNLDGGEPDVGPPTVETQAPEDEAAALRGEVEAAKAQAAEYLDGWQRARADFANYKRRVEKEQSETYQNATARVIARFLDIYDDFERAIRSAEESKDFPNFLQGIGMIEKQFVDMLESRWGLKRFSSVGEGFDPNRHEAVQRVEGPAGSKPTVVEDYQKGYYLHERVLRPARVKVMVPAAEGPPSKEGADGGQKKSPAAPGQGGA